MIIHAAFGSRSAQSKRNGRRYRNLLMQRSAQCFYSSAGSSVGVLRQHSNGRGQGGEEMNQLDMTVVRADQA